MGVKVRKKRKRGVFAKLKPPLTNFMHWGTSILKIRPRNEKKSNVRPSQN